MKMLFLGGDKRQLVVMNFFNNKDHEIDVVGYEQEKLPSGVFNKKLKDLDVSIYDVIFFPVNGVKEDGEITAEFSGEKIILDNDVLKNTKRDALIFTGILNNKVKDILTISNRGAVVLMEDKVVTQENSIPTVEGIIGDLINNTEYTINDSNILVFGYGNVGKPLVEKLEYLGAKVTVGVLSKSDYNALKEKKIKVFYTFDKKEMINNIKFNETIINTATSKVLDKEYLKYVSKNSYILDVASHPHGIDVDYANELGLNTKVWMGIPSAVAPKTAAKILTKKINSIIGGDYT